MSESAGNFAAHHLDARLPLAVDAVLQAEWAKLVRGDLAGEEALRLLAKSLDLLANGLLVLALKLLTGRCGFLHDRRHIPTISYFSIEITAIGSKKQGEAAL